LGLLLFLGKLMYLMLAIFFLFQKLLVSPIAFSSILFQPLVARAGCLFFLHKRTNRHLLSRGFFLQAVHYILLFLPLVLRFR